MAQSTVSIKGATFTVYGTQAGINDYFKGHSDPAAWDAATTEVRNRARVTAARSFDRTPWLGIPTDLVTPQDLAWPRDGVSDRNGEDTSGVTPDDIEEGNWEWVLEILKDGAVAQKQRGTNTKRQSQSEKVDVITVSSEVELFKSTFGRVTKFPPAVHDLVGGFLAGAAATLAVATGTSEVSVFSDVDFGLDGIGLDGGST